MPARSFRSKGSPLAPYHLRDDFGGGGTFDSRSGSETGVHFDGQRASVASTLLAGRFRPQWRVYDSGPALDNGAIEHSYGRGIGGVVTGCEQTIGEWRVDLRFTDQQTNPDPDVVDIALVGAHTGDDCPRWGLRIRSDRSVGLYKRPDDDRDGVADSEADDLVTGLLPRVDRQQTVTVTRTPHAEWQLSINGISQGVVRDSYLPPTGVLDVSFHPYSDAGSTARIEYLEVR